MCGESWRDPEPVQQKRGRLTPPFLAGQGVLPLLAALLLSALSSFLRHCVYPPLRVGFVREEHSPYRSASAYRHSAVRPYAARRFVLGRKASPLDSPAPSL